MYNISSWIRRCGFWTLDLLKGGKSAKVMHEIKRITVEDDRDEALNAILTYAKQHIPFYRSINADKLTDFPVMNKLVFKEQGDNCLSDEYTDKSVLHKVSTSGSTGTPMTVYLDTEKRRRVTLDLINAHNNVGWKLGDKFIFIRNWSPNYKQSKIKNLMQNVMPVSIAGFDVKKKDWLTSYLLDNPGTIIFGYASAICDYMNYLEKQSLDKLPSPKLIVCDSDELSQSNKKKLMTMFRCPVINRYDNEENGLLAITSPTSDVFTVNYQSLIIELLEMDSDKPVKPGQVGRVVVTDLYNKAMPLIRYDTGDCAMSLDSADKIRHLEKLCGRSAVYLTSTDGLKISSVAICAVTEVFSGIERYQLIQNSKTEFVLKYSGQLSDNEKELMLERLHNSLGQNASIDVIKVERLEAKSNGKFATIVNNCM